MQLSQYLFSRKAHLVILRRGDVALCHPTWLRGPLVGRRTWRGITELFMGDLLAMPQPCPGICPANTLVSPINNAELIQPTLSVAMKAVEWLNMVE